MKDLVLFGGARCCFASPLSLTLLLSLFLSLSLSLSLLVRLFVRWHYAEHTRDRRGYDSALAALSPELRSSWVDREHNRGCPVL